MKKFQIDHSMRVELLELYKILSPYPETKTTLEQLKKRNYKIAILSNGTPSLLNDLVEKNDMKNFFDDIFFEKLEICYKIFPAKKLINPKGKLRTTKKRKKL